MAVEETQEELKKRLDACNLEMAPILDKYEFEIGAQAFTILDDTGVIRVQTKPVLVSIKGRPKEPALAKP